MPTHPNQPSWQGRKMAPIIQASSHLCTHFLLSTTILLPPHHGEMVTCHFLSCSHQCNGSLQDGHRLGCPWTKEGSRLPMCSYPLGFFQDTVEGGQLHVVVGGGKLDNYLGLPSGWATFKWVWGGGELYLFWIFTNTMFEDTLVYFRTFKTFWFWPIVLVEKLSVEISLASNVCY